MIRLDFSGSVPILHRSLKSLESEIDDYGLQLRQSGVEVLQVPSEVILRADFASLDILRATLAIRLDRQKVARLACGIDAGQEIILSGILLNADTAISTGLFLTLQDSTADHFICSLWQAEQLKICGVIDQKGSLLRQGCSCEKSIWVGQDLVEAIA